MAEEQQEESNYCPVHTQFIADHGRLCEQNNKKNLIIVLFTHNLLQIMVVCVIKWIGSLN